MTEKKKETKNFSEQLKSLFSSPHVKKIEEYARENSGETAAYILLGIGLLLTFVNPLLGSALIGLLAGFFFYDDVFQIASHVKGVLRALGPLKVTILLAFLIIVFFAYPFFFIAFALVIALMQLFTMISKKPR